MPKPLPEKAHVLDAIRLAAQKLGHPPSRSEFIIDSGISEYQVLRHFPSWREAVRGAGLEPDATNIRLDDNALLQDWGEIVRKNRQIPTRHQYRREGSFSPGAFEKHFGPWSAIPAKFKQFAQEKSEWADVVALLPVATGIVISARRSISANSDEPVRPSVTNKQKYPKLDDRPTYGNPIDFRGLRHEPVNEQGVVFLFGMIAKELGYMVEAVQTGYPDCEAKRQVEGGRWQRVRIEFEFESRSFCHAPDGCDVIVCWRHNWPGCPENIEVIELSTVIESLAQSED